MPGCQEKARAEAAKKKAEAKKLAEEEDAAMAAKAKKTPSKAASAPKVTMSQLQRQKEAEKAAAEEAAKKRDLEAKRMVRAAALPACTSSQSHCCRLRCSGTLTVCLTILWARLHADGMHACMRTCAQVTEDSYGQLVDTENVNIREEGDVDARSVEAALAALSTSEASPEDRHPERCGPPALHALQPCAAYNGSLGCCTVAGTHLGAQSL
jgi:hypothetical protein